ncbi:MAG: MFS transporter [Firmicutes bacterium]|nr:MFS transporter [Dethiobacter sp.]MBS3888053.1 MFS transporter [Bacillota bacterium]MBS4055211.1 MFS transporter [Thermaerobacter sp.]
MSFIYDYVQKIKSFSYNARLFLLAGIIGALYQSVYGVLGNLYILQAGLGEDFLGLMISLSSFASVLFALPAGMLSDYVGRRRSLLSAAVMAAATHVAIILHPTELVIVAATIIGGAAGAVMMVTSSPFLVENSSREERNHLFSVNGATWTISGIIGSFLGGALPLLWATWLNDVPDSFAVYRATLLMTSLLLVLSVVPYALLRDTHAAEKAKGKRASGINFPPWRLGVQFLVPEFIMGFGAGMIIPFLNVYFAHHLQATAAEIGLIFSVMMLVTTVAILAAPLLGARYGKVRATTITRLLSVPLLLTIALTNNLWVASMAAWFRSALMNMSGPLVSSFTMEILDPAERATMSSALSMTWTLAWGISARLGGHIMKTYSYNLPYFFTAVLYVLSALAFYYFFAPREAKMMADASALVSAD